MSANWSTCSETRSWPPVSTSGTSTRITPPDPGTIGPGLTPAFLAYLKAGDTLVVWKLDRLGRSLPHLLEIMGDLRKRGVAFRSLTEAMNTGTPHGELLFSLFGALAQFERQLTQDRVIAGLAAAKRRGRQGGRPPAIGKEQLEQTTTALADGASKASVCRSFKIARSTLIDTLERSGWHPPTKYAEEPNGAALRAKASVSSRIRAGLPDAAGRGVLSGETRPAGLAERVIGKARRLPVPKKTQRQPRTRITERPAES